ncbi:hypothetical protein [Maridesulfovibrio sp. FT414]|uniref:hypothetical protein n=1 Tax=Maridesulfovibrio sp. FT414 TaxID=2979469 RepID=UPI003D8011B1
MPSSLHGKTYWDLPYATCGYLKLHAVKVDIAAYGFRSAGLLKSYFSRSSKFGNFLLDKLNLYRLEIPYGPVSEHEEGACLRDWISYVLLYANRISCGSVEITPPYYEYLKDSGLADKYDEAFSREGFSLDRRHSIVLDVSQGEDAVFQKMHKETRRKARKSMQGSITIERLTSPEHIEQWMSIKGRNTWLNRSIMNEAALNDDHGRYEYYVALEDGVPLAWQGVRWGYEVGLLEGNAISTQLRIKKSLANYALQMFMINRAHERGVRYLDWVGADPDSEDPKLMGILKFKKSWGGELVSYNLYTKTVFGPKILLVKCMRTVARQVKELLQKIT